MGSKVKVEFDHDAMRELLRSDEMLQAMSEVGERVRARVGYGYATSEYVGRERVNVSIRPTTKKAKRDNRKNNTLLKAIGGMNKQ